LTGFHGTVKTVLIASLSTLFLCGNKPPIDSTYAPDFMLNDLQGNRFYLNRQNGKIILLNFWSVYCVPCIREMPQLARLWNEYKDRDIVFAGICTDAGEEGYIQRFMPSLNIEYSILLDIDGKTGKRYGVQALPTTIMIDRKGLIRYRWKGYENGYERMYARALEALLEEHR
jgi:peroxiredoxin